MSISKKRLNQLAAIPDEAIDYSDIPELDEEFWKDAKIIVPERKQSISLRIDSEIYQWFKDQGPRYQSKINAILKSYVEAQKRVVVRKLL